MEWWILAAVLVAAFVLERRIDRAEDRIAVMLSGISSDMEELSKKVGEVTDFTAPRDRALWNLRPTEKSPTPLPVEPG